MKLVCNLSLNTVKLFTKVILVNVGKISSVYILAVSVLALSKGITVLLHCMNTSNSPGAVKFPNNSPKKDPPDALNVFWSNTC